MEEAQERWFRERFWGEVDTHGEWAKADGRSHGLSCGVRANHTRSNDITLPCPLIFHLQPCTLRFTPLHSLAVKR